MKIIQHPVPINMNILKALGRSSLGLDLCPTGYFNAQASATALLASVIPPLPLGFKTVFGRRSEDIALFLGLATSSRVEPGSHGVLNFLLKEDR